MNEFERIERLPNYIFAVVNDLKMQARRAGEDVIDFSMGNPDGQTPKHIVAKLIESAQKPKTHGYSVSKGIYKLREAIITTINEKFKLEEKLHGSCHILAKICERHSLKVPFKIEFIVLVDVTEDFVNRIRDESKNHSLLRLRKLGDKNSSLQFIEKNFCTIVGFVKDMLKGILNDRCENFSESLSALITDCKCLDCGEFKLFLAGNESNILFP